MTSNLYTLVTHTISVQVSSGSFLNANRPVSVGVMQYNKAIFHPYRTASFANTQVNLLLGGNTISAKTCQTLFLVFRKHFTFTHWQGPLSIWYYHHSHFWHKSWITSAVLRCGNCKQAAGARYFRHVYVENCLSLIRPLPTIFPHMNECK